ncbi:putative glycoside hydrolase family 37 [Candidatus Nitrososphaera gargensis Ga9.2]|uniref:Putative glycoside hydrolase family 37 n=1 Tax=Nitrososphaera gargensis (strain Ga9.2) TaxID=1237085 RepID=K0ILJ4_NITGG|nr:hypothetical protein [Candidatus Nitrososphaera gargensis]AFU57114.1 putative glycoside hydrolase family 37 [Candidatus Nitrososphaera gargensis Ga9.2]
MIGKIIKENHDRLPEYKRKDVKAVENGSGERPIKDTYYRTFIYLVKLMREYNYDERLVYRNFPFKTKDVVFSTSFYVSNKCLLQL